MLKTTVNARPHFLENTNLILPETIVPAEDLHREWQYLSNFVSFHAIIFRKSHGRKLERLVWKQLREISTQGHSKSHILGSVKSQRWTAYHYITTLALSQSFRRNNYENAENCRCWQLHCCLTPLPMKPHKYPHKPYIARKLDWLLYISDANNIHTKIFVVGSEMRMLSLTECETAVQGHLRSLILAP